MQRLFLVRHGPTHAKGMIGWTDLPADLSDTGALKRLDRFLPDDARVVSSDLIRTVETANAIERARKRLPHHPKLREMHFGDWENLGFEDVSATSPDHVRAFYEQPGDIAPPNGESWNQVRARVSATVDALLAEDPNDLIVVCHFGVVLSQLQRATGLQSYETFAQKIDNLSVTEVIIKDGNWNTGVINHCP
ncbi:histidine phosphatase family protein [Planktotalea frisia]|jgi:alpha-ribazole phosphatase|uniref:histidine phosphatase family protein n=1 Tax=Planktotalea frisia TaxID=696762 RepID=UPI002333B0B3|nr:histidine phosphatase family protein [Planktotalea frisia]MDB4091932.1 histidine phosphatase family protein [bacterium]